ncbi:cytochrome d ubiquinol oxidase subunit II [Candidatus Neomicrothrix sp.]|jgi:cytochrome d ubiquinol oxidase subunit II|uniref:cytochrome d ubiquinol oxidase subunit II n=1 Tax=Candidatus Neomicrothrix sp. TaxID=2719034 RepID=UPI001B62DA7C|nr:cytochrome d ubiquinol oxidase subunit II [Candidatus Microthrix sp.]MBK6502202.1 cytochrome d ubiquinol oxidase subunit II [Candidatus Microthrix sp.]MBK7020350.1 cytochrome d ubiquinol oxidase subunit II [Candidatus Microthrix sp.]MBK7322310.1 cytochrome d ubiquinol oxidase subunit II [Candidatus Microthrix sp.]MBP6133857.1 cytochrome d ubiquinol oxidase subunit II [Candidatus Microthrix sp.]MBP6148735.1 cytochrome d ubiquinol oxidase subunit II [Candidatus Microthrix sp.]
MELTTVWFILIAVLWIGYFVLEGFDFGVGILFPVLGRDDPDLGSNDLAETGEIRRRVMLSTVGPVWDGNEVWLLTAGGATFAAFPHWYATLFSGFYLPLLLILVALIMRALAFDYRGKVDDPVWRRRWDWAIFGGSLAPALLWGVAFTNIVRGVPIDAEMEYTGNLFTLLNPAALLGGVTTVALFTAYGAMFLALKTDGAIRAKARDIALRVGLAAAVLAVAWLAVIHATTGSVESWIMAGAGAVLLLGALAMLPSGREGWAFALAFAAIAMSVGSLFVALFPDVMPSTTDPAFSLTTTNASSTDYTLKIMTWVAVVFTPIVIGYQGWSYWTFRKRVSGHHIPTEVALAARPEAGRRPKPAATAGTSAGGSTDA